MALCRSLVVAMLVAAWCAAAPAQTLEGQALVAVLRAGGCVIVMRHASSPAELPEPGDVAPGNTDRERQLDAAGRATARAMGAALRALGVPFAEVLASPTFRAMQTAELVNVAPVQAVAELGDGGQGMQQHDAGIERSAWLRAAAARPPPAGTNRLMITHSPNLRGAFADAAADMADGESLVIRPERGDAKIIAHVKIEEWPTLLRN